MNAVVEYQHAQHLTAADIKGHVNLIQQVMQSVMKDGVHYGIIPGTDKPTLYKPGAEKICETFRIAPSYVIEDLSGKGFVRYRIRCVGTHQTTGLVLGEGLGECSSLEEKYKWRRAYDREWDNTPETHRRLKYGWNKKERKEYEIKQVRTEPADLANTILKMACKRALVHMTITVTAAGDVFHQDLEDMPEEIRQEIAEDGGQTEPVQQPRSKSAPAAKSGTPPNDRDGGGNAATKALSDGAKKTLRTQLERNKLLETELVKAGFPAIDSMTFDRFNDAMAWAKQNKKAA